jgi:ABC-type uncharacterized transport system auxiliary subunit
MTRIPNMAQQALALMLLMILAGCATPPKPSGNFSVKIDPSPVVQISNVKTHVDSFG